MADTPICIDISKWQKGMALSRFKAAGGLGVIAKASEGTTIQDSAYAEFRLQAMAVGLKFASYHFFRPGNIATQADWYLKCASPAEGERVICDWEDNGNSPDDVVNFFKRIQSQRPDLQLTVYSGHVAKEKISGRNAWLADNTSLWVAQYSSKVSWPSATWPQWSLWQYSDSLSYPWYSAGPVDSNRFNGPDENFLKWIGPASDEPAPSPIPDEAVAVIEVHLTADRPVVIAVRAGKNVTLAE